MSWYPLAALVAAAAMASCTSSSFESRLRDLGYYDGPAEGHPWRATIMALERFQRDRGLPITLRADFAIARTLRDSICF